MKTETQDLFDKLQADLDRLKEIVSKEDEPKFEVGRWYKCSGFTCIYNTPSYNFGLGEEGEYRSILMMERNLWELATDEEVLTAFTNYFRSKGAVSGKSKFKSPYTGTTQSYKEPLSIFSDGSIITSNSGVLFDKPTLTIATLIEDEKIYVGENEVQYYKNEAKILGRYFTKHEIEILSSITLPIFQKILDRLEK